MKKQESFEELIRIIAALRSENGCPWDKEQTHQSLRPCMMEEAAELVSSIRIYQETGNYENMREELGDVLLQVVMHSQIAEEEGLFTIEDVISEVSEKMVRRHPHVFGAKVADSSDQVLQTWEEIKKEEKEGKTWIASPLREIPKELPALTRGVKVLKKIDKLYEAQPKAAEAADVLADKAAMLKSLLKQEQKDAPVVEEALGSMLIGLCNIAREYRIPIEQVLTDKIEDMIAFHEKG